MTKAKKPLRIECHTHGRGVAAVVCGHMIGDARDPVGFVENSSEPDDLQAWCLACEAEFLREDGLTARFREFTNMTIVCSECYALLKARHEVRVQ